MKPEDLRKIALSPGTRIGLIGDYNGESEWSNEQIVEGHVKTFIVVVRHHNMGEPSDAVIWDTAMLVNLQSTPHSTFVINNNKQEYIGNQLILLHRYWDKSAWDNQDPNVQVLGIKQNQRLPEDKPLSINEWLPKTVWLSSAASMFVNDPENLTEMANALLRKYGNNNNDRT